MIHQPEEVLNKMNEVVTNMHTESGLLNQITASTLSLDEAGRLTLTSLKSTVRRQEPCHFVATRSAPIADFSLVICPKSRTTSTTGVLMCQHQRTCSALVSRGKCTPTVEANSHRALDDIKESVAELQHYQRVVFRSPGEVTKLLSDDPPS